MKPFTQKSVVLVLMAAGVLVTSLAMAAPSKVAGGLHDFSTVGGSSIYKANTISQVCIFCHTPHNAGKTNLLWNKAVNSVPDFRLYTSSGTLTLVTKASSLSANSPSLLCLSCHDGKTAMNVLHNSSSGQEAQTAGYPAGSKFIQTDNGLYAPVLIPGDTWDFGSLSFKHMNLGMAADGSNDIQGNNLTDDHPIGFSYSAVLVESPVGLKPLATAKTAGIRFFGSSNKVECSSCHDPHVDYSAAGNEELRPFLVMSNSGSNLCRACHDK